MNEAYKSQKEFMKFDHPIETLRDRQWISALDCVVNTWKLAGYRSGAVPREGRRPRPSRKDQILNIIGTLLPGALPWGL